MNEGYIPIPNSIFDKYLGELTSSEMCVLLAIIRKTWGWNKTEDRISVSQLISMTSLGKNTVIRCLESLQKKKLISTKKRHNRTTKIKLLISGAKMGTPIPKMGTQLYPKVNTQQYNNNTYKPQRDTSPILGGLIDLSQFEDS